MMKDLNKSLDNVDFSDLHKVDKERRLASQSTYKLDKRRDTSQDSMSSSRSTRKSIMQDRSRPSMTNLFSHKEKTPLSYRDNDPNIMWTHLDLLKGSDPSYNGGTIEEQVNRIK